MILTRLFQYRRILIRFGLLGLLLITGVFIWQGAHRPPKIVQLDPITTVIEVPVEKLTTKTVKKYVRVEDRAAVNKLLAENKRLKTEVQLLTIASAESTSTGSGPINYTLIPPTPENPTPALPIPQPFTFKDYRLEFASLDGKIGTYTLTQKFSIVNTVGRNDKNVPVNIIGLFELDANNNRREIPIKELTTIIAKQPNAQFYLKPTLQAGISVLPGITTNNPDKAPTGLAIAIPWLKRGTGRVVETTRYAYLTPTVVVNGKNTVIGVMPISVNTGTLKYTPFSDIWVSPFVGADITTSTRQLGMIFSATF